MSDEIAAAGIQVGGNFLSSVWNELFYNRHLRKQTEASKDMMDYQHNLNLQDWNMQNEYNLPSNQYERYVGAGMSPVAAMQAVAGQSSSGPAVSPVSQSSMSAQGGDMNLGNIAGTMLDARQVESDRQLKAAQARYYDAMSNRTTTLTPFERDRLISQTLHDYSSIDENKASADKFRAETRRIDTLTESERKKLVEETNLIVQKIAESKEYVKNMEKQRDVMDADIALKGAEADYTRTLETGQVYDNYTKFVGALKADITRFLIENYHVNPDDDFWKQIIEAGSNGEKYAIDFIQGLGSYAQGVDGVLEQHFPHYKTYGKIAGALYGLGKLHDRFNRHAKDAVSIVGGLIPMMNSFKPTSLVDGYTISY